MSKAKKQKRLRRAKIEFLDNGVTMEVTSKSKSYDSKTDKKVYSGLSEACTDLMTKHAKSEFEFNQALELDKAENIEQDSDILDLD